jgi:hypothetical protein
MNTKPSSLVRALVVLTLAGPAVAAAAGQDPVTKTAPEPATLTLSGSVTSKTATALVLKADDGSRKTFVVDGDSILPEKLVRGTRVTVTYETKGEKMRAVSVSPTDAAPPARPKTPPTQPPASATR